MIAASTSASYGIAINLGGGYHHAVPDHGGGFCIYADMPIASIANGRHASIITLRQGAVDVWMPRSVVE